MFRRITASLIFITSSPFHRVFVSCSFVPFQLEMIWGNKTQKGPADHPISNIEIETPSSFNPFLDLFREMRMSEDNDVKTFQKFLMRKGLEGRWGHVLMIVIFLITHVA